MHATSKRLIRAAGVLALGLALTGCGEYVRQGNSPVTVVINRLQGASGATPDELSGTLNSDVETKGGVFNDIGEVTFSLVLKDPGRAGVTNIPSALQQVTFDRYHVDYARTDGRNTPGVDVPYGFDSAFTATVPDQGFVTIGFELVHHLAKLEAPLLELRNLETLISTIGTVTFYGHDQAGNEVTAQGQIGITFGNFADPD